MTAEDLIRRTAQSPYEQQLADASRKQDRCYGSMVVVQDWGVIFQKYVIPGGYPGTLAYEQPEKITSFVLDATPCSRGRLPKTSNAPVPFKNEIQRLWHTEL